MSKYPENVTSFTPIELKLGIKSSLPNAKQAIVLIYLLWKTNPMQAECVYSVETAADLIPSDGILDSIRTFLTQNGIAFDSETLSEKIKQNPLFSSQIEHLNVAFELIWKLSHFDFVADMPFSAERSGGKRYAKKILFTTNIDILDATIESNKNEYLRIIYSWLIGENVSESQKKYEKLLTRLLTCFSEDAYFQIRNNASNILFRNYEMYKTILSDSSAILDGEKSNNGSLRILCSSLKEGLNNFVVNVKEDGKNVAKRNDLVSVNDFSAYCCRVENFLKASNRMIEGIDEDNGANAEEHETSSFTPSQIIYYGVPGCGKSHTVDAEINKAIKEYNVGKEKDLQITYEKQVIRTVFHPDYCNADFVGQLMPKKGKESGIKYEFKPGPLATIIRKAYLNPKKPYFLVIEEINRGNAAAIFGEMFQLLDRYKKNEHSKTEDTQNENYDYTEGWSKYSVNNDELNEFILLGGESKIVEKEPGVEYDSDFPDGPKAAIKIPSIDLHFSTYCGVRLPPNLSIYATMNTSDQNVFTLDNAFQRRWEMKQIPNDWKNTGDSAAQYCRTIKKVKKTESGEESVDTNVQWGDFRKAINEVIMDSAQANGLSSMEDKRLGGWFFTPADNFAEKVLKYLWDDAFKFDRKTQFGEIKTLEDLVKEFNKVGFKVFKADVISKLQRDSLTTPDTPAQNDTSVTNG